MEDLKTPKAHFEIKWPLNEITHRELKLVLYGLLNANSIIYHTNWNLKQIEVISPIVWWWQLRLAKVTESWEEEKSE